MTKGTKRLTGVCSECGGPIEFPAELVGTKTTCPRCRKQTELMLAPPPAEPPVLRKAIIRTVITAVILVAGLILTLVGLNYSEKLARQKARAAGAAGARDAMVPAGFEVSAIALEKGQGSAGIFAVGTVVNTSSRPRSRVTVEFDLVDARGEKVEVARAYRPTLEAGAKWEIKVPVAEDTKAVSARLASIKEEP